MLSIWKATQLRYTVEMHFWQWPRFRMRTLAVEHGCILNEHCCPPKFQMHVNIELPFWLENNERVRYVVHTVVTHTSLNIVRPQYKC